MIQTRSVSRSALMGLSLALALGLSACGEKQEREVQTTTVSAVTTAVSSLPRTITASGTVSAWEEVPVGAETGGLTATIVHVDEGSYVRQGQALVQMNDVLLRAQLRQQQAAVQTAEANAARDDAALSRAQDLKERGFLSQASLDQSLANQRASAANLASARAGLSETQTRLSQAIIRAPVSGLIVSRSVTRGQIIQPGQELFRIVRDGRLELDAQVPETELAVLSAGQSVRITSSQTEPSTGTIRIVTPQVDGQTRLGIARISLDPASGLKAGMFARAEISAGEREAITVPNAAVLYRDNKAGVYVIGQNNVATFTPVKVLLRNDESSALEGLQAGVRVAVDGAGFLSDGDVVTIAAATTRTAPAAKAEGANPPAAAK